MTKKLQKFYVPNCREGEKMKDLSNENVIHVKKGNVEYLQFRRLLEYTHIINHAYSIGLDRNFRTGLGNSTKVSEEEYKEATKNYQELANAIQSDYIHVVKAHQKHTKNVQCVYEKKNEPELYNDKYKDTDGLITSKHNVMLATTNADCILLLFFDSVKKVIANTHSGWRGTLQRISVETVEKMQKVYGSNPQDIICCICPSIRKCHFEVEKEVKEEFKNEFKELDHNKFIEETMPNEKWNVDTVYINIEILKNAGLKAENIIDSKLCSVCNKDQIHSFRAEGENYGLATAIIEIKG